MQCKRILIHTGPPSQSVQTIMISVAVCVISSSLFFVVGLLCHRYCPKQKHLHESIPPTITENQEMCVEQVELTENVAYSPVQLHRM